MQGVDRSIASFPGSGAKRWMTIRVVPDATPSGEVHGAFVLMNDIRPQAGAGSVAPASQLRLIMDNVAHAWPIDRNTATGS
jgi:hypothetical protein